MSRESCCGSTQPRILLQLLPGNKRNRPRNPALIRGQHKTWREGAEQIDSACGNHLQDYSGSLLVPTSLYRRERIRTLTLAPLSRFGWAEALQIHSRFRDSPCAARLRLEGPGVEFRSPRRSVMPRNVLSRAYIHHVCRRLADLSSMRTCSNDIRHQREG